MSDDRYDEFLAAQRCDRDRALVTMFVSSGARAQELLEVGLDDLDWGGMRFWVISKGTRAREEVPASPEAMRLLAKYLDGAPSVPPGEPIWRTRRGPNRPLQYPAMRAIIQRANASLGTNWTAHDFRHTLCTRLSRDEAFRTEEIQTIMRHANITTTGIYQHTELDDVIDRLVVHYDKPRVVPVLGRGFNQADMQAVFGG
ncbi:site-specific integrase [Nocardioides sp.]|uniref:tyrosine-type recombinase/integrase n=1 Tax=Nocardioides sp. TaxID=35761 RepID=UPI002CA8193F|nr:site-specific integrase [Nocardioides sp.]HXH80288.1 site-specific integrase [Nocardioides sp.]